MGTNWNSGPPVPPAPPGIGPPPGFNWQNSGPPQPPSFLPPPPPPGKFPSLKFVRRFLSI